MMYNIHSFDSEFIKLHNSTGTRNFYERQYNYSENSESYKFLLRIRKNAIVLQLFKMGRDLFER